MKRIILMLPILLILTLALSACGKPPTVNSDFSSSFTAVYQGEDYEGTLRKDGDQLTIAMQAPYTVDGISFDYQGDTLSIRCADHSTIVSFDYLPDSSIPTVLYNTLAYLPQATYIATENDSDTFTLPTPYGDATLSAQDGVLRSLTDPHSGLEFTFG